MPSPSSNLVETLECEIAMLGGFMVSEFQRAEVLEICKPEMLSNEAHRVIYTTLADMFLKGQMIGVYELLVALRKAGNESKVGGADFLMKIVADCPDDNGASRAAEMIREFWTRGKVAQALDDMKRAVLAPGSRDDKLSAADVMDRMSAVLSGQDSGKTIIDAADRVAEAMEQTEDNVPHPSIGLPKFDASINIFRPGDLTIVAGRPGGGKSSLMRQIIWRSSVSSPVLVFTLEVSPDTLIQQLCCEAANVPFETWRKGTADPEVHSQIAEAMGEFQGRQIKIYTKARVAALQVSIALAQLRAVNVKPSLIVVDYLGLMDHSKAERNDLSIGATTRALKLMALEQKVAIVLLCQMNRESEKRGSAESYDRPRQADLRDSGNIEQDADNIVFLWKRERDNNEMTTQARVLTIAKQRTGRVGDVEVLFDMPHGRFTEQGV